ncbi:MAG: 2-oxoacid:acceptor oxidoreductase family protein, partial [Candidatus Eremiobacteraeota bacterium]|nr:2-oxoacid:acceptor oxidoreductase family protein [Candidatus Eremiobacteraeota bacterium]
MSAETKINDFTLRIATVNGSGSQSSNLVLTNAIFRLGIPVAPKNVFPSNIEGLPTWFDVRVSADGYQCRTRNIDILVGLNPTTWHNDVPGVKPGGLIVHDSTFARTGVTERADVTYFAVPFTELAKTRIEQGALRKYLTNMIYVGVLAELLGIDVATVEQAVRTQFKSKASAVESNMFAVRLGVDYTRDNFSKQSAYQLKPLNGKTAGQLLLDG